VGGNEHPLAGERVEAPLRMLGEPEVIHGRE
jgi:hypothetical protein